MLELIFQMHLNNLLQESLKLFRFLEDILFMRYLYLFFYQNFMLHCFLLIYASDLLQYFLCRDYEIMVWE